MPEAGAQNEGRTCHFIILGPYRRCTEHAVLLSPFCAEHKTYYSAYDNKALLEMTAHCIRECCVVTENRKIGPSNSDDAWARFTNLGNELLARGYTQQEWAEAASRLVQQRDLFADIYKAIGHCSKWRKFERVLAQIHRLALQGAIVTLDDHIVGRRTGRRRQIDISIRFDQGFYEYLTIVECKNYSRKVGMNHVEAFHTKLEDTGAQKGIMVSSLGFQSGAVSAAKTYGIELYTLAEQMTDWTKQLRRHVIEFPWIVDFEFDHDVVSRTSPNEGKVVRIMFRDFWLYDQNRKPIQPLAKFLSKVIHDFTETGAALPCRVTVSLDPPCLVKFPGEDWFTPLNGIKVTLAKHRLTRRTQIDKPPTLDSYLYSDLVRGRQHRIPANQVP